MLGLKYRVFSMRTICYYLLAIALSFSLISCGELNLTNTEDSFSVTSSKTSLQLSETAPPKLIRDLEPSLTSYKPQVTILEPSSGTTVEEASVNVKLSVKDFPLFKDEKLGLGFNLHLIVDNEPYIAIYNLDEPIILENLTPGTHTIRVIASSPWHESFKNQGAYAQNTFNVVTETEDNRPDPDKPLLTYSNPNGNYSTEPIMLDFYVKDPSRESLKPGDILPNSVKVTVNDESFIVDQWQPVYLQGFKKGNNLVQIELIDSAGNPIDNVFNSTVRLITYEPDSSDPLAKLVTNQISLEEAQAIIDPEYYDKLTQESEIESQTEIKDELEAKETQEIEKQTDELLSAEESEAIEEEIEAKESDVPVAKESELETIENSEESASVTESEIIESEVDDSQVSQEENSPDTETIIETKAETLESDVPVAKEPELETEQDSEESAFVTESEIIESEVDDSQVSQEDNSPDTETIIETKAETVESDVNVAKEPELETIEDSEESAFVTESETIELEIDDSQLSEDNSPVKTTTKTEIETDTISEKEVLDEPELNKEDVAVLL